MGLDPLSPVAPARVRCLLLPCGRITRSRFLEFAKRLQDEAVVRLSDVSPTSQPERNTFSPLAFPPGVMLFDLVVSESSAGQKTLYPFEVYREPFIVLGLADALEYGLSTENRGRPDDTPEEAEEIQSRQEEVLRDLRLASDGLRATYSATLVNKIFLFDCSGSLSVDKSPIRPVPPPSKSTTAGMKTIMCDLASELLSEMAVYAKSVQALATIETPRQIMPDGYVPPHHDGDQESKRQSWFPGARTGSPSLALQRLGQRASLPAHLFQGISSPPPPTDDHSRSAATSPTAENAATTFEQMHIQSIDRRLASDPQAPNDRMSVSAIIGSDALTDRLRNQGRGRVGVVMGQMYLAAGRWPDAVRELVQAGIIARSTNDHIWHAKAVESILVALILCAWAEVDFDVPPLCLPIAERSSVLLGKSKKKEVVDVNETFVSQAATKEAQAENLKTLSSLLPEIVHHIIRLYTRSTAEHIAQLALSEVFIRLSKLSAFLLLFPGFSPVNVLESIVLNRHVTYTPAQIKITSLTSPNKAEIAAIASASIPHISLLDSLSYIDRLSVHAGAATVLGMIGYHRKKAFVLRDLLTFLLPALERGPEKAGIGLALFTSPVLKSPEITNGSPSTTDQQQDGPDAVYEFLALLCRTYGAITVNSTDDLDKRQLSRFDKQGEKDSGRERAGQDEGALLAAQIENEALTRAFGSRRLKLDVLFTCMSVCEVIPDLKGAIAFASSLLRTVGSGMAPGPQDIDGAPSLAPEDQVRVSGTITQAASTAQDLGIGQIEAEYWDDFLLRDVEILPITPDLSLTPRKRSDLAAVKASLANQNQGPFIVNQFTSRISASKQETVLATGEKFSFAILLQNLNDVNLEIDCLEIDSDGVELDAKLDHIVIGPYKTQRLRLIGQALAPGQLTVRGCKIKIRNCNIRRYPIRRDGWRPKQESRLKRQGLSYAVDTAERPMSTASEQVKAQQPSVRPSFSTVVARLVDAQPRLVLQSTSIPQDNVMILEGERKKISITFRNASDNPVDFASLTFDDSTLPILNAAVQDRELPAAELYEIEYGIYKRTALSWTRPTSNVRIEPGREWTVEIEVLGKPGLTSGTVILDYAATGKTDDGSGIFYTRRLPITFAISVSPSIDLVRNDVFLLTGPLAGKPGVQDTNSSVRAGDDASAVSGGLEWTERLLDPVKQSLSILSEKQEYCLLLLDFYNSWGQSLTICPEIKTSSTGTSDVSGSNDNWVQVFRVTDIIDPGQSARFLVPMPRVALSDAYAPIPSLNPGSKRQFVVSTGKISEAYERSSRDAFWHREAILQQVRVRWQTVDASPRHGSVELRAIRLTMRMLDALKVEAVSLRVELDRDEHVSQVGASHFRAAVDEFVTVRTTVVNQSKQAITPILRLQPSLRNQAYNVALDLAKKFAFTGLLQQPLAPIEAGSSVEVVLGSIFLCAGEFEIGATIEELQVPDSGKKKDKEGRERSDSQGDLDVLSTERKDRRIWFAKEPCKVDVAES